MHSTDTKKKYFAVFLFLYTIFALYVYFYLLPQADKFTVFGHIVYNLCGFFGLISGFWLIKIFGGRFAFNTPWGLTLGMLCWVIGDFFLAKGDITGQLMYPDVTDYFYILAYPCFLIGIFSQSKILFTQPEDKTKGALMATGAFLIFLWVRFSYFGTIDTENSTYQNIFNVLYSIGDSSLVAGCVYILYIIVHIREGALVRPWIYLLLGFVFNLAGFAVQTLFLDKYFESNLEIKQLADIIWIVGYMFSAYGIYNLACVYKDFQEKIKLTSKLNK